LGPSGCSPSCYQCFTGKNYGIIINYKRYCINVWRVLLKRDKSLVEKAMKTKETYTDMANALGIERVEYIPNPNNDAEWITYTEHESRRGKLLPKGSNAAYMARSFYSIVNIEKEQS